MVKTINIPEGVQIKVCNGSTILLMLNAPSVCGCIDLDKVKYKKAVAKSGQYTLEIQIKEEKENAEV